MDFQGDGRGSMNVTHIESSTHSDRLGRTRPAYLRFRSRGIDIFFLVVRIGIGGLLIYSSITKIMHPYEFLSQIYNYELTGPISGVFTAIGVTAFELMCGLCLVTGLQVGGAITGGVLLFSIFTVAQASVIFRGLSISCGCFSPASENAELIGYATLIRTLILLVLSTATLIRVIGIRDEKSILFMGT